MGPTPERVELHNLAKDPHEKKNQASSEPDRVARLSKMMLEWRDSLPAGPPEDCISKDELPASPNNAKGSRGIR